MNSLERFTLVGCAVVTTACIASWIFLVPLVDKPQPVVVEPATLSTEQAFLAEMRELDAEIARIERETARIREQADATQRVPADRDHTNGYDAHLDAWFALVE